MAYMSQEGDHKLVAELKQLVSVERPKASAAIAEARDKGDLVRILSMMPLKRHRLIWKIRSIA